MGKSEGSRKEGKKEFNGSAVQRFDGSTARSLTVKRFKRFNSSTAQRFGRGLEEMGKEGDRKKEILEKWVGDTDGTGQTVHVFILSCFETGGWRQAGSSRVGNICLSIYLSFYSAFFYSAFFPPWFLRLLLADSCQFLPFHPAAGGG